MSSKAQVLSNNVNSFPNNNSGQITPQVLRDFNADFVNSVQFTDTVTPNAVSASFAQTAVTASFALNGGGNIDTGSLVTTASFNAYTASNNATVNALTAATSSYVTNAQTSSMTVASASNTPNALVTASVAISTITFTKGDGSTFNLTVAQSGSVATASLALDSERLGTLLPSSFVLTSSYNPFTASINAFSASMKTFTGSIQTQVNALEAATSSYNTNTVFNAFSASINSFTASSATSASNALVTASVSSNVITFTEGNGTTFSLTVGSVIDTGSFATTASYNAFTSSINAFSASQNAFTSSMKLFTGSIQTQVNNLQAATSSYVTNAQTSSMSVLSASFATTAGFAQTIASGLNITASNILVNNNLTVLGTASFAYTKTTTGSAVIIGDEFIILNADTPTAPFAGIMVYDTGSNATASFEWNGNNDYWITVEESGASAGVLTGISGSKGAEVFPALNTLTKGSGNNEIRNSNITDNGSVVAINSNSQITGSLGITGNINMVNGTDLVTHHVKAPSTNGVEIQNNSAGVVGLFGAGGSLGSTFYGQVNATAFSGSGALVTGVISSSYAANAQQATSASFASTASFYNGSVVSASYALSASQAQNAVTADSATSASFASTATSASYSNNSTSASYALNATSASIAQTASFYEGSVVSASYAANSTSASYALNATSASFAPSTPAFPFSGSAQITGSLGVTGSIRQIIGVGSGTITAITNSFVGNTVITGSGNGNSAFRVSGSVTILKNLQIGSAASTANNTVTLSSLTSSIMAVDATGDSTTTKAQLRITSADSSVGDTGSAVIITSAFTGSTFGDYDTTAFVNRTFLYIGAYSSSANPSIPVFTRGLRVSGSLGVTGSLSISGSVNATSITSSLLGTASYADNALSASYSLVATSASYVANSTSASYANTATSASYALNATSASVAVTASFALTTAGGIQGSEIYSYTFLLMGA